MKDATFHPRAEDEFAKATQFYRVERPNLASTFAEEVVRALDFLRSNPDAGTPLRGEFRRWLIRRFPYSLIYRVEEDRVHILALAHQRRRPDYWQDRR